MRNAQKKQDLPSNCSVYVRPSAKPNRTKDKYEVRVPADYCWQVLSLLLDALGPAVDTSFVSLLRKIVRKRDVPGYYDFGDRNGLQSMAVAERMAPGYPAIVRLLTSVIRKHERMELVCSKDRYEACILGVRTLDSSLKTINISSDPVMLTAQREIASILGAVPTVEDIADRARHGPGSSTTHNYSRRSAYFKFAEWPYHVSPAAQGLLTDVIRLDKRWVGSLEQSYRERYRVKPWNLLNWDSFWRNVTYPCPFNRITTVPKDGTRDRPIAIEPAGNIYLQLGVEGIIRQKLLAAGCDLNSQEHNRKAALKASRDDSYFTIDLSNASDTISLEVVKFLLPGPWFDLLASLRSRFGLLPSGEALLYQKFSSMGNGYTFVLESLIFYAISRAISTHFGHHTDYHSVYGDDIIGQRYLANHHFIYLQLAGFVPNRLKSFIAGPVRESCGIDAYFGEDIRPVFLKRQPRNMMDVLSDRNRLNRWFSIHFGCENPRPLDNFFEKYVGDAPAGPESDTEFDSYWHMSGFPDHWHYESLSVSVPDLPARDIWWRKLMHSLHHCDSEGGNFLVKQSVGRRIREVRRGPTSNAGYTASGGLRLDFPKHPYGFSKL